MTKYDDLGHEPEETHDREFAPVNRGSDARGRTVPPVTQNEGAVPRSGTGVPGESAEQQYSLPPDEEGVREAEEQDATRDHPRR
ncbi:hypothetical protein [Actinocorallia populi]|uniref:hypothetical protein n=1 Tax=Actinocorallia populi TaxID=2079200 RepID=UPI000D093A30|nr:hypothetical protein [Actinocorallia populi]